MAGQILKEDELKSFFVYSVLGMLEVVIRTLGLCSELLYSNKRYAVERRARGLVFGLMGNASNVRLGRGVLLEGLGNISISDGVTIYDHSQVVSGISGKISIGKSTHIGRLTLLNGLGGLVIGENVSISAHVSIYTVTNIEGGGHRFAPVNVGDSVLIGAGASVLPGVSIGANAVIGAGAVVTCDVEANSVVAGVPAKSIK